MVNNSSARVAEPSADRGSGSIGRRRRRRSAGGGCGCRPFGDAAFDAEFVALRVGEQDPVGAVGSAVVGYQGRADSEEPSCLFVAGPVGGYDVEVYAVLDRL